VAGRFVARVGGPQRILLVTSYPSCGQRGVALLRRPATLRGATDTALWCAAERRSREYARKLERLDGAHLLPLDSGWCRVRGRCAAGSHARQAPSMSRVAPPSRFPIHPVHIHPNNPGAVRDARGSSQVGRFRFSIPRFQALRASTRKPKVAESRMGSDNGGEKAKAPVAAPNVRRGRRPSPGTRS